MELRKLMVDTKAVWLEYPGLESFEVEVVNLSRKELTALRKRCINSKFDRKTRQLIEELDEDKFVIEFSNAVIKNWKGLTLEHLQTLLLIDTTGQELNEELPYSKENAQILISSSNEFDTWLNEVVFDLDNFRDRGEGGSEKPTGKTVQKP